MTTARATLALALALAACQPPAVADSVFKAPLSLPTVPDHGLTPGAVETTDAGQVCPPGYARERRHVSMALHDRVFAAYGVPLSEGPQAELDHLVPLELGGASVATNLWPEPLSGP